MNPEIQPHLAAIRGYLRRDEIADSIADVRPPRPYRDHWLVLLRWLAGAVAALAAVGLVVVLAGCGTDANHQPAPISSASVSNYIPVEGVPDPNTGKLDLGPYHVPVTDLTDQQLAAALDAICTAHPGACVGQPVTVANLRTVFLPYVCWAVAQTEPPAAAPGTSPTAWQAAWTEIGPLVVSSGRCSE